MKFIFCGLLLLATAVCIFGQTTAPPKDNASASDPTSTGAAKPQDPPYVRPSGDQRFKRYVNSIFGPYALGEDVALAGINTWRNSPAEWGTNWDGFGRRAASNFGKGAIRHSIQFGLDEALKEDSYFYRSTNRSVRARVTNALISPFTARTASGRRTIGVPRLVGTYTAAIIATETWYPARYNWKDGVKSGTISLGASAAFNLIKEFIKK